MRLVVPRGAGPQRRRARPKKCKQAGGTSRRDPPPQLDNAGPFKGGDQTPPRHTRGTVGESSGTRRTETPGGAHVGRLRGGEAAPDESRR